MKTILPKNDVSYNYNELINCFIDLILKKQRNNVISIFLTGSYARGDAGESSDLDVWCIFEYIDSKVLQDVGECVHEVPISYSKLEINPQCFSMEEVKNNHFSGWIEKSVKILDGILLYGEDLFGEFPSAEELKLVYKKYLVDVLMSIRHYISVDEPVEKLTYKKIKTYIFKPLMFPLRIERYCTCGHYPESNFDLLKAYEEKENELVEYFLNQDKFEQDIRINHREVLKKLHDSVLHLLNKEG